MPAWVGDGTDDEVVDALVVVVLVGGIVDPVVVVPKQ